MVRKHQMHLPWECQRQLRHATQHAVTEINTVYEPVAVDQFMEDQMIVRRRGELGQLLHQHEVHWVVMQITSQQDATAARKEHR